jgi:hypothetical protein
MIDNNFDHTKLKIGTIIKFVSNNSRLAKFKDQFAVILSQPIFSDLYGTDYKLLFPKFGHYTFMISSKWFHVVE